MTFEENIAAALTSGSPPAVCAYPEILPQKCVLPAVTYTIITGRYDFHLLGPSGTARHMVQVDCWAGTRLSADQLMDQSIIPLMCAYSGFSVAGIYENDAPRFEDDTRRYRASRDFVVWHTS